MSSKYTAQNPVLIDYCVKRLTGVVVRKRRLQRIQAKAKPWGIGLHAPELDGFSLRLSLVPDSAGHRVELSAGAPIEEIEACLDAVIAAAEAALK